MLVPKTADDFRVTNGTLWSLDACRLLKNLGMRMSEADIPEQLEALHIQGLAVMLPWSRRRNPETEKDRPILPLQIESKGLVVQRPKYDRCNANTAAPRTHPA
jgi:hypothetical protein